MAPGIAYLLFSFHIKLSIDVFAVLDPLFIDFTSLIRSGLLFGWQSDFFLRFFPLFAFTLGVYSRRRFTFAFSCRRWSVSFASWRNILFVVVSTFRCSCADKVKRPFDELLGYIL